MSYDPAIGAWMERDPDQYIDGPNLYETEHDNPVNRSDPFGTESQILGAPVSQPAAPLQDIPLPVRSQPVINVDPIADSLVFEKKFINAAAWGQSEFQENPGKRFIPCPNNPGFVRPNGYIWTQQYVLVLTDESAKKLQGQGVDIENLRRLIQDFNNAAADHEKQVIANLQSVWCPCSSGPNGNARLNQQNQLQAQLDSLDEAYQRSILEQVLSAAGLTQYLPTVEQEIQTNTEDFWNQVTGGGLWFLQ